MTPAVPQWGLEKCVTPERVQDGAGRPGAVRQELTGMTNGTNMPFSIGTSMLHAYRTVNYGKQKMDGRRYFAKWFFIEKKNNNNKEKFDVCKLTDSPCFTAGEHK